MMTLAECRTEIDRIDREMVALFQERMRVCEGVARYKMEHDLPVLDSSREAEKMESIAALADEDMEKYVRLLYNNILEMSKDHQKTLMEETR